MELEMLAHTNDGKAGGKYFFFFFPFQFFYFFFCLDGCCGANVAAKRCAAGVFS